jgi:hypothetical protein
MTTNVNGCALTVNAESDTPTPKKTYNHSS